MCVACVGSSARARASPRPPQESKISGAGLYYPLRAEFWGDYRTILTDLLRSGTRRTFLPGVSPSNLQSPLLGNEDAISHMATAGTPVRRARSFHRVRAPLNELGEPARSYHGRAMSSLSLKEHTRSSGDAGSSSSHTSFPANREPSLPPACGTPVRRARSFQRVLSPRRERSCSLPAEGASSGSGAGVGGVEVTQEKGGGSGSGSSGAPFPSAGRPVRRAGSFQRVVYPRSSRRSKPSPWPL